MNNTDDFFPSLAALHYVCQHQHIPFVSYRLPQHSAITTLIQYKSLPNAIIDFDELNVGKGYVIAPFTSNNGNKSFLLQPDLEFKDNNISTEIIAELSRNDLFKTSFNDEDYNINTTSRAEFESNVNKAIATIKKGELRKVVISKTHVMDLPDNFSASHFYQKLCVIYPNAYIYFLQIPEVGCWIGATPEPLLTTENDLMHTVSLAGTQAYTDLPLEQYTWSEKELDEQAIVTNFIAQTLTDNGIIYYSKSKVENYRAANLIHLKSGFEFSKTELKNELSKLINALHPTPSTGGLPKTNAREFILETEKHNRSYYTGFLGTIHPENGCQLYVNLRCMKLLQQKIVLYSGAGITASSVAEKEWIETENKLETLKKQLTPALSLRRGSER
jgi:isochorismate synthase